MSPEPRPAFLVVNAVLENISVLKGLMGAESHRTNAFC